jgi:succinoglycan biosynthesis transport protein ExoP
MNVIKPSDSALIRQFEAIEPQGYSWLPELLGFLRRRWQAILAGLIIGIVLGVVYLVVATPKYTASAELLIDSQRADPFHQQPAVTDSQTLSSLVESEVEVLRSDGLMRKVVQRLKLADDPQFMALGHTWTGTLTAPVYAMLAKLQGKPEPVVADDNISLAAEILSALTSVRRIGLTYVIEVDVKALDPDMAAKLANGIISAYVAAQFDAKYDATHEASDWLQTRIADLRAQALSADRAVQDYKAQNNIVDTDKGLLNEQELAELNSELVSAHSRTAAAAANLDRITAMAKSGIPDTGVSDVLQNTVVIGLQQRYFDDARQESVIESKYGANHIAAVNLRKEMAEIQHSIQTELGHIADTYRNDLTVAKADEQGIQDRVNQLVRDAASTNSQRVVLRALESSADTYRALYENFLQRYTQAVQDQSFPVSEARVVTQAVPPINKSSPRPIIALPLSAILGLGFGFALAFLRESTERGIRTAGQVRSATGLDCVGLLPRLRGREMQIRRGRRESAGTRAANRLLSTRFPALRHVLEHPQSPFALAVRGIRVRLARLQAGSRSAKVVGCISAQPGEGTSTVAANLAQFLARGGQRTILVDGNPGVSSLTHTLAPEAAAGLPELLSGKAVVADTVWRDEQTGLHFLPAGHGRHAPTMTEILASPRMEALLAELRASYDQVVIDLPALSPVADAHAAAHLMDAFVLVIAWADTDQDVLTETLSRADLDEARLVGAVLNKVDMRAMKRYWR